MKKVMFGLLALTLVTGWASPALAAGLKLTIRDGRVSLDAQDVTIRQILTEWARVGKTKILNLERVSSATVTLKLENVPEDEALDVILRAVAGYFAAPRAVPVADASKYDRIALMTSTSAPAPNTASVPRPQGATQFFQDPNQNITQLRAMPAPLSPGMLPDPANDANSNANDPAIAAANAAGLNAAPPPGPFSPSLGPLQPPSRNAGAATQPTTTAPAATANNPWNAPVGSAMPGLPTPAPPTTNNPPPNRPVGVRPQEGGAQRRTR